MRFSATSRRALLLALLLMLPVPRFAAAAPASETAPLNVQQFLDRQPGVLKRWSEGEHTAAEIIQSYTSYYNLDPRIVLALMELDKRLLSEPNPAPEALRKPLAPAGPEGFAEQVESSVREIRAGFGPYEKPPEVSFVDGGTETLDLAQEPSTVAVQRFLAIGRTRADWRTLVDGYLPLFRKLWNEAPKAPTPTPAAGRPFLRLPWPAGTEVIHSSYFDHVYPTVDRGEDDNSFIVDYLGRGNLSYNTHDGHDFYFPDKPIGTPMLAAAPGTAYAYTARGNGVVIRHAGEHAGYETVYWHLDQFAAMFKGKIDNGVGVPVQAGTVLGSSGKSGFTVGGAHLHFEVRHNGRQVDPYGWYGPGSDPCAKWTAGCEASVWLWHDSTRGVLDLTRPGSPAPRDTQPPIGSLAVAPDTDLGLLVPFDDSIVPLIGKGAPMVNTERGAKPKWEAGVFEQAIQTPNPVQISYPISGNLELERGTISMWAKLPQQYPSSVTRRHYLFAASSNPEDGQVYTDTLALRREPAAGGTQWNFWTVDSAGKPHDLAVPDKLSSSWHHFAVTWDREAKSKALYIDGKPAAVAGNVELPATLGERLQLGRFIASFGASNAVFDELAVFRRALGEAEVAQLAARNDPYTGQAGPIRAASVVTDRNITLDSNAIDAQGGIVSVQLRRNDEPWSGPQPYYDSFRWMINGSDGEHTFAIKYRDRADNETIVTTTLTLAQPLVGGATLRSASGDRAVLGLEVVGLLEQPTIVPELSDAPTTLPEAPEEAAPGGDAAAVKMQLSNYEDFRDGVWEPFTEMRIWNWPAEGEREVWVRFRDGQGRTSVPQRVTAQP